ncbi:HD domain-containing protein [Streptacidiphilus cavernicola]|uniref:Metal-dependent phosphohydrolase n=1 Tax=Streptacidiphilus cavernicola TaxID=3342716 RepID=A0ABV6VNR2_9ACTN
MPPLPHPDAALAAALLDRWTALLGRLAPAGSAPPAPFGDELLRRWSEPQRRYHTLTHLAAVLDVVDHLAEQAEDADAVRLGAWFHDAVYAPDRAENEERSARLAERVLPEAGVPAAVVAEAARLVRLTTTHEPAAGDRNGEVLCDADLAVLGGAPAAYAAYAAAVREEYGFVPDAAFRAGRAEILEQLLGLPALFRTERGHAAYEEAARGNLRAELDALRP